MEKQGIEITSGFELFKEQANLDTRYGPWTDTASAIAGIEITRREIGLTIGVIVAGEVEEYWWKANVTNAGLIAKTLGGGGGGNFWPLAGTGTLTAPVNIQAGTNFLGIGRDTIAFSAGAYGLGFFGPGSTTLYDLNANSNLSIIYTRVDYFDSAFAQLFAIDAALGVFVTLTGNKLFAIDGTNQNVLFIGGSIGFRVTNTVNPITINNFPCIQGNSDFIDVGYGSNNNSTDNFYLRFESSGLNATFIDARQAGQRGIEYGFNDYSALTNDSLVTKGYVDSLVGGAALIDGNATTANGTAVDLGGTLTANVAVAGLFDILFNPNNFNITGTVAINLTSPTDVINLISEEATFTDNKTIATGFRYLGFGETDLNTEGAVDYSTLAFNSLIPRKFVDDLLLNYFQIPQHITVTGFEADAALPVVTSSNGRLDSSLIEPVTFLGTREYDVGDNPATSPGPGRVKWNSNDSSTATGIVLQHLEITDLTRDDGAYHVEVLKTGTRLHISRVDDPTAYVIFEMTSDAIPQIQPGFPPPTTFITAGIQFIKASDSWLPEIPDGVNVNIFAYNSPNQQKSLDIVRSLFISNPSTAHTDYFKSPSQIIDKPSPGITINSYSGRLDDGVSTFGDVDSVQNVTLDALNAWLAVRSKGLDYVIQTNITTTRDGAIERINQFV